MSGWSITTLQSGATANGNGVSASNAGYTGATTMEVAETGGGTATVTIEGSFDGTNWYAAGFAPIDNATITRSVTGISVLANSRHPYQILDNYPQIRARISAIAGGGNITVKLYTVEL